MKAMFSCDVTKTKGAGHLMRSVSIAERARESGIDVVFSGVYETAFAQSVLLSNGFKSIEFCGDSEALANLAVETNIDLVHCDDYNPRPELHGALSAHGIALSSMEDGGYGARNADVIIDPSPFAETVYRPGASSATHLRGLSYAPLRQSVIAAANARKASPPRPEFSGRDPFRVLILLGGTDASGATKQMVDLWTTSVSESVCFAVLPGIDTEIIEIRGTTEIHWLPPSPDVARLLSEFDAVITAAGTTVWEVGAIGTPGAAILQAENQRSNYDYVVDSGALLGLGRVDDLPGSAPGVRSAMKRLRSMGGLTSAHGSNTVDLEGADRIVSEWMGSVNNRNGLRLRDARMSDASSLFDWRNDVHVRAVSRDNRPLTWENHVAWLRSVLADPNRKLLVAVLDWTLAGTVRFDEIGKSPHEWEISIALSQEKRGQGLGDRLLKAAEDNLRSQCEGPVRISALVKADNHTSSKLFARNGYDEDLRRPETALVRWGKLIQQSN
jgi:spore coat polysaccharide biosynthesis predicted glycosyltransferase SpsG/RimJ/RimL family protein N-acetyltransferase